MKFEDCSLHDACALAELRASAMKPGLQKIGRFDEERVRSRFLDSFVPADTKKILVNEILCGFFVVKHNPGHLYLDHLYVDPDYQNRGIGGVVLEHVVRLSEQLKLPVRLGALKQSRANEFYRKHGFVRTHEDAYDIYYERSAVIEVCLLYTSPSPRDGLLSRMPSSA